LQISSRQLLIDASFPCMYNPLILFLFHFAKNLQLIDTEAPLWH
jgi:hypothetical protein